MIQHITHTYWKLLVVLLLLTSFSGPAQSQRLQLTFPQVDWSSGWAAAFKVGTLGPGLEAIKSVNENWNARVGFSYLPFRVTRTLDLDNLNIDMISRVRLGGVNLQGDFFFHPWYYFTGGLLVNLTRVRLEATLHEPIEYGDISITPEDVGEINIKARPTWLVSPFLGVGIGNPMPVNRRVWFNVELGVLYHGKPKFFIDAEGMIEPTANAENEEALKQAFKGFRFYPMFSAQVNYLIR